MRARTLALILTLGLSTGARADEDQGPRVVNLKSAVLVPVEGPRVNVEGGVWLSDKQAERVALRLQEPKTVLSLGWVVPTVVGILVGGTVTYYVTR